MALFKPVIENSPDVIAGNRPDVIALVSSLGKILHASASGAKVFGYLPEVLVGRTMLDLIHLEDRDQFGRAFQDAVARPIRPIRLAARVCRKDWQWSTVESTISNLLDEPRVAAIVVECREVDARTAPTEKKHQHIEEPPRRRTDFEDFASTVAHDLREPLKTISMFTDLLVGDLQY